MKILIVHKMINNISNRSRNAPGNSICCAKETTYHCSRETSSTDIQPTTIVTIKIYKPIAIE